jgi:hypothetical protein
MAKHEIGGETFSSKEAVRKRCSGILEGSLVVVPPRERAVLRFVAQRLTMSQGAGKE